MLKKQFIKDKSVVNYWRTQSKEANLVIVDSYQFHFEERKNETLLHITNRNYFKNSKFLFVQARFSAASFNNELMTIEIKPKLIWLYTIILSGAVIFLLNGDIYKSLFMISIFSVFMLLNMREINKAIRQFKEFLLEHAASRNV